jgi:4'-phosphopantetheinyl transferase
VWTVRLADGHRATADLLRLLDQKERARAMQFTFEWDRTRFIQAHGIARLILARYSGSEPATLTFACNRHGKPYLVPRAHGPNLQFSMSRSGYLCMLAVGLDHSIGVDVEKLRELPLAMDVARKYFTPAESRALAALQGTSRRDAFLVWWTHKEAIIKGMGISLAADLGRVELDFDPAGRLRLAARDSRSFAEGWSYLRLDGVPGHVAALASAHPIRSLMLQNWNQPDSERHLLPGAARSPARLPAGAGSRPCARAS